MKSIVIFILMMFCIQLQAQIKPKKTSTVDGWEIWQDKIPISGGVRVGFMFNGSNNHISPNHFYVKIPDDLFDSSLVVDVELSSKDGRYSAKLKYPENKFEKSEHEIYEFILPTNFEKKLTNYSLDEVVILTTIKNNKNLYYLISSWEEPNDIKSASVYVNSIIPIKLDVEFRDVNSENRKTTITIECSELNTPNVAYNKKCIIPNTILSKELIKLTIKQRISRMGRTQVNPYYMPLKN